MSVDPTSREAQDRKSRNVRHLLSALLCAAAGWLVYATDHDVARAIELAVFVFATLDKDGVPPGAA